MAQKRGIAVVEDAAQSIGSEYNGRRAGSMGEMGAFSFYPTKNLGAWGDGGLITTNDLSLAERLTALRVHGRTGNYLHQWIGVNSRLDSLQAAVLRVKLQYLDTWSAIRQKHAAYYRAHLAGLSALVIAPEPAAYQTRHVYNQFVIRCSQRDALEGYLREQGIGTEVYYPLPLHLQPCYACLGHEKGAFPISEKLSSECLALPVHPNLSEEDLDYICGCISSFYRCDI
jgi:dTDP-4-amino-4,6-dideoxygalactose transaminase